MLCLRVLILAGERPHPWGEGGEPAAKGVAGGGSSPGKWEANPALALPRRTAVPASRWTTCLTFSSKAEVRRQSQHFPWSLGLSLGMTENGEESLLWPGSLLLHPCQCL